MKVLRPLNYIDYNKEKAKIYLENLIGWNSYSGKHGESTFTKYFQSCYLMQKHKLDKRLPHLSSLINAGQITRDKALKELSENPTSLYLSNLESYVFDKLQLSSDEIDEILKSKPTPYDNFPNNDLLYNSLKKVQKILRILFSRSFKLYS